MNIKCKKITLKLKDWTIPFGLFGFALAVRIPWLWEIPRYIDELREVKLGYLIYLGKTLPLHNVPKEVGALHNYILAGIFFLFGPNAYWPRLYVALPAFVDSKNGLLPINKSQGKRPGL
ncbi:MAG: hypothetical protein K6U80_05835 [Firmicutes bacterium]|nr:hypothetical protein [Bacillota bacterium]